MSDEREETQNDRCTRDRHLWRRSTLFGFAHMRCLCGAVHPNDLDAFLSAATRSGLAS